MPHEEYIRALNKAVADLEDRAQKRDLINAEIAGLRETVRVLSSRVPLNADSERRVAQLLALVDYATPTLKDSIRTVLARVSPNDLTAIEIRNALEESAFNFDDFSNSLSACHAALKRMTADKEIIPKTKDGKASYWLDLKIAKPTSQFMPFFGDISEEGFLEASGPEKKGPGIMKAVRDKREKKLFT
jgi:hypothetical protein